MPLVTSPLNILVIEDNEGDYLLFEAFLAASGLQVQNLLWLQSLSQALASKKEVDIIFLDLSLPDSGGTESFTTLNEHCPNVPIVVLSGMADEEMALQCIALGAQDYLLKNDLNDKLLEKSVHYSIERKRNLEQVKESNRQYEMIGNITNDIIWKWNMVTKQISASKRSFFNYSEKDISPDPRWWMDRLHPEDRGRAESAVMALLAGAISTVQDEYRFRCMDGSYKYIFCRAAIFYNEKNEPTHITGAMMDITDRKRLQDELIAAQLEFQKGITEAAILGQEKEKEKIGKELHDNINQILASVKLYLDLAIATDNNRDSLLKKSKDNVVHAIDQIRKLSHSLIPPSLGDHGLIDAINELIDELNMVGSFRALLSVGDFEETCIDEDRKIMLYRVIQEQMNNIMKHSGATEIMVMLKMSDARLYLAITDNGKGFDLNKKAKGIGLRNIESRVSFYSGTVSIESEPGKGTSLVVSLPLAIKTACLN